MDVAPGEEIHLLARTISNDEGTMIVQVKDLNNETSFCPVLKKATVAELKWVLSIATGMKIDEMRLAFNGQTLLEANSNLSDYDIAQTSVVLLVSRANG